MIVALSFIVSLLPTIPGPITKFTGFPLLLGGLLLGPRTGFAVGCLTDLIGFAFRPFGPFFPGFTLTQGLTCMLPGLLTLGRDPFTWLPVKRDLGEERSTPEQQSWISYLRLVSIFGITQLITSVLMVSYFTSQFVIGTPLELELATRALAQATHVPVYAFMALAVLRVLSRTDLYERVLKARK